MSNWLVKKKHMRIAVNSQAKKKKMSATEQSREEEDKDNYGTVYSNDDCDPEALSLPKGSKADKKVTDGSERRLSTKKCYASTSMEGATSFFKFKVTKTSFSKFLLNILTDRNLFKLNKASQFPKVHDQEP
uniref:Uncharacterized protein n=1 Tax=Solanum lycopersicum TaxID=4081 RepID=A0A3Q7GU76_SOLLC